MKKTYIAPDVLIVDIETQFVMANSDVNLCSEVYNPDNFTLNEGGSRSNLWGED